MCISTTQSRMERFDNLQIAASYNEDRTDSLIGNLFHLLGYRQKVAQDLLRSVDDNSEECKAMNDLYNRVEYDIKRLLGIQ